MKLFSKSTCLGFAAAILMSAPASAQYGQACNNGNAMSIMGAIACAGSFSGNNNGTPNQSTVLGQMQSAFGGQVGSGSWWNYVGDPGFTGSATGKVNFTSPVTGYFVVILKSSTNYSMYLFNGGTLGIGSINFTDIGTSLNHQGVIQGLSHASLYSWNGPSTPPVTATPEPGTMVLMGSGLAGLVAFRRRRRKA